MDLFDRIARVPGRQRPGEGPRPMWQVTLVGGIAMNPPERIWHIEIKRSPVENNPDWGGLARLILDAGFEFEPSGGEGVIVR